MRAREAGFIAGCVAGYSARLHAAIGDRHHVASPLGAWLLLALAGPASTGQDRDALTGVLGCDVDTAAEAAGELLSDAHPVVASAAAVWTARGLEFPPSFRRWQDGLPSAVTRGDKPGQPELDAWAREHTFGLIDRFPVDTTNAVLVLASALATKVSWLMPFDVAPAASLGAASPWAGQLGRVLRTPQRHGASGHVQFIGRSELAGDVIVHAARAVDGLLVVSVGALPEIPAGQVLAAAHDIGGRLATGAETDRRDLASLPLGESPLWIIREVTGAGAAHTAVLPAWSASSRHDLTSPGLGFDVASRALLPAGRDWDARQSAVARYSRTGFEAVAVSSMVVRVSAALPVRRREAELRFGHPYAVVAFATGSGDVGGAAAWHGLPVFSAWVSEPEDTAGDPP